MGTMTVSAEGLLCSREAAVKRGPLKEFWIENTLSDASFDTYASSSVSCVHSSALLSPLLPT